LTQVFSINFNISKKFAFNTEADSVLVIFNNGNDRWLYPDLNGNLNDFKLEDNFFSSSGNKVVSLWEDPPEEDIYNLHDIIIDAVNENQSLFILLDSYGWLYREHLEATGHEGFLSKLDLKPMRVPYPPKTNNSYWVTGTGRSWQERNDDDEYFADVLESGNTGLIIETDKLFYTSPVKQLLHIDENNNGSIDDEVLTTTLRHMDSDLDLLLTHFHSLDDVGHSSGAYSEERLITFKVLEKYVEQLVYSWPWDVYIFSDHGMHTVGNSGKHNTASPEDIIGLWGKIK